MSRRAAFAAGAGGAYQWPPAVGVWHDPELVSVSQAGSHWHHPGRLDIPLQIHELPHELRERTGSGQAAGAPIDIAAHPHIGSHLYHVTTNKPAVLQEGLLRASGGAGGGLGGHHAAVVSLTTDRPTAFQIHRDLKMAGNLGQQFGRTMPTEYRTPERAEWGRGLVSALHETARAEGWEWSGPVAEHQLADYSLSDWMSHWHSERQRSHPARNEVRTNPVLLGEGWTKTDPAKVGIVRVPKAHIVRTGALVTDFDLRDSLRRQRQGPRYQGESQHGHFEVRVHGDVPL